MSQGTTMRAAVQEQYGSPEVLRVDDVRKPQPGDHEVLIRVLATTVTATEAVFRQGKPYVSRLFTGLQKPKNATLGEELAGEIAAVGKDVTLFAVGDRVFGTAGPNFGAAAEYVCVAEDEVITAMPQGTSPSEAAGSVDGFLTALPFLRDKGGIREGHHVLVNGASGSVGSAAVQIAKTFGAEVTGVCSTANVDLVKSIGADHVIDYTNEDFTANRGAYDIIFDAVGKTSFSRSRRALKRNGVFLEAGMSFGVLIASLATSVFGGRKARFAATGLRAPAEKLPDLNLLREMMESGTLVPVIDRSYPLAEVREAHRYVDTGRKRGNVVIEVGQL